MKVAIVGAGAIGGLLGARLARAGNAISVLARGETLAALAGNGWHLEQDGEEIHARIHAAADAASLGEQDIVVIAVKGPALAGLAARITPLIGRETLVVPAMNGVPWWFLLAGGGDLAAMPLQSIDPAGEIARAIPLDRVIGTVVHANASAVAPGRIRHKAGNRLIFGEPAGVASERLARLCAVFADAGFAVEQTGNIRQAIWYKLWGNMTMNPLSALTGATCDRLLDDPLLNAFILRVMAEARQIGERIGCRIDERGEDRNAVTRQLGAFKTSMLQDVEAGRPLEIDNLLSAPREIAAYLGIETPNLDTLTGLLRQFAISRNQTPPDTGRF